MIIVIHSVLLSSSFFFLFFLNFFYDFVFNFFFDFIFLILKWLRIWLHSLFSFILSFYKVSMVCEFASVTRVALIYEFGGVSFFN
jgi:hypothetical protein